MTAPERIWANRRNNVMTNGGWASYPDLGGVEYHLAREGQPCSDREFMEMVSRSWEAESSEMGDYHAGSRISAWIKGDFTAAMEGL